MSISTDRWSCVGIRKQCFVQNRKKMAYYVKIIQTVYSPHEPQHGTTPNTKTSLGTDLTLHTIKYQRTTTNWWATEMFPPLAAHYDNDDEDEFFSVLPVTCHIPLAISPLMIHKFSSLFKNLTHNSMSLYSLWVSTRWSLKTHLRDSGTTVLISEGTWFHYCSHWVVM